MNAKTWLTGGLLVFHLLPWGVFAAQDPQVVGGVDVSRWRGFNLLEKFTLRQNAPYLEDDFRWIAELGFNYVRLPVDYRCYVQTNDWLQFREEILKHFDQAIAFGDKYHIHVSINLHRAPGFCINPPAEPTNLWTEEAPLEAFVAHWVMFARRYKDIPSSRLSFNLLNEPARHTREQYIKVFTRAIEAIQAVDPKRLIIVDGMNVGAQPAKEFLRYSNVVQATRGYHPGTISHYRASWVQGSEQWPEPTWPPVPVNGMLYGPAKPEFKSPLALLGEFPAGTRLELSVQQISVKGRLTARADGKMVGELLCDPQTQAGEWKVSPESRQYTYHEPVKPLRWTLTLTQPAREITVENVDGDWVRLRELALVMPGAKTNTVRPDATWGRKQSPLRVGEGGRLLPPAGSRTDQTLRDYLRPWVEIQAEGQAVFVGEWGCFNRTPHPVALAWMKDWLELWKQHRMGWALWNFRGSFGILDSGRNDVQYEDFHGHKLDRKMLELLQQYLKY
jgi:aryl-phospho-beta-D-glucosidase BglC (GH1 family)